MQPASTLILLFGLLSVYSLALYMTARTRGTKRKSLKESDDDQVESSSSSSSSNNNNITDAKPTKRRAAQRPRTENFTKKNNIRADGIYPMNKFPYHLNYKQIDLRKQPHLYRWGVGEQGVLMVEPYKSELLPDWKFKDPQTATKSSKALRKRFDDYVKENDFVGADMARKFIQMGFTRSRRYANHKGGRKYSYEDGKKGKELPKVQTEDKDKAESAEIFKAVLEDVKMDSGYIELRRLFEIKYKDVVIDAPKLEDVD